MATYAPEKPVNSPPAQKDWTKTDISESDEKEALNKQLLDLKTSLKQVVSGHIFTPLELSTLNYEDEPMKMVRSLTSGWDRHGANLLSHALLDQVENAWSSLKESVPQRFMPKVIVGEDEFITFCWAEPGKRLEISFYQNDATVVCDCIFENSTGKFVSDERKLDRALLATWVREFAAA